MSGLLATQCSARRLIIVVICARAYKTSPGVGVDDGLEVREALAVVCRGR